MFIRRATLILVTPKNQRLGDLLGHTVVVREQRAADRAGGQDWKSAGGFARAPRAARPSGGPAGVAPGDDRT